ncbi:MAG: hypothetical protein AAF560_13770 [Acidobacteriota bacterium]
MSQKVQCVGYAINTGPRRSQLGKQEYLGLEDTAKDVEARIALVKAALDKAAAASNIDASATKVFVIPEFFFRGRNGGYDLETIMGFGSPGGAGGQGLIGGLQELIKDDKWSKWIFVFGSTVGFSCASKEKEVLVGDIKISFCKPVNEAETKAQGKTVYAGDTARVKKLVSSEGLTLEETLRLLALRSRLVDAFMKDGALKNHPERDELARKTAENLVGHKSVADIAKPLASEVAASVNESLAKVDTKEKYLELLAGFKAKYGEELKWEAAADDKQPLEAYNITLVQEGGFGEVGEAHRKARIVIKRYKSGIDFIKRGELKESVYAAPADVLIDLAEGKDGVVEHLDPWLLIKDDGSVNTAAVKKLEADTSAGYTHTSEQPLDPLGIVQLGNLHIALDVCLDHWREVAKKTIHAFNHVEMAPVLDKVLSRKARALMQSVDSGVDLHVVPSCGMSIVPEGVVAKEGGWVFNCDGLNGEKLSLSGAKPNFSDVSGYTSAPLDGGPANVGNAHTGLMRVEHLNMGLGEGSALVDFEEGKELRRPGVTVSRLDSAQVVLADGQQVDVSDLYWKGEAGAGGASGGELHVYDAVEIP